MLLGGEGDVLWTREVGGQWWQQEHLPLPSHPYFNLLKCRWKIKFKRQNFPLWSAQSQHPQEAEIKIWNLHDWVRKQLLSTQYSHSTLSGLKCLSLEGLHKQNQRTPISSRALMLGVDGKEGMGEAPHWAGSWMLPMLPPEVSVPQPFLTLTAQAPSFSHSPPPEVPSCETCSLLVGWRKNPALVLDPSSPTHLLPHIGKNADCHKQQEPFNNKLLLLCWMFCWSNSCENFFLIFPGGLGFCAHSNTAFTSTTDSDSRGVEKTQN